MRMQNRADAGLLSRDDMEQCFGRRFGLPFAGGPPGFIDADEIAARQTALVFAAGCHEQFQRFAIEHDAVIAARAYAPAALPERLADGAKRIDRLREASQR